MEVSMKYRTQGSLPISAQHKAQYIPRIPEEPAPSSRGKAKDSTCYIICTQRAVNVLSVGLHRTAETPRMGRGYWKLNSSLLEEEAVRRSFEEFLQSQLEAPVLQGRSDEDHSKQQLVPKFPEPPTSKLEPLRFRRPAHDPCRAIIETSPYYIYFKIVTTEDARKTQDQDLKSVLSELVVIDEDLPRTAKYRHFRSYEQ